MITIGKLRHADYYLREVVDGVEDYYIDPGEAPGRWSGVLASKLGLAGIVEREDLEAAFAGTDPRSGVSLTATRTSVPGFDLTLSVPKSYSVLWALADAGEAREWEAALYGAADAVEAYLSRRGCEVRRGHAGAEVVAASGFVGATFFHRTSRLGDPGMHIHWVVLNATEGPDGKWRALDGRALYRERYTAEAVFQAVLRYEAATRLSAVFEPIDRHGVGEVAGVPAEIRRAFSRRRMEILDEMTRRGVTSAEGARVATLSTRRAKSEPMSEAELRRRWRAQARELGYDTSSLPRLPRTPQLRVENMELAARLTDQDATFSERDVTRAVAIAATQGATLEEISAAADAYLRSEHAVALVDGQRWTTPEMLALERRAVRAALRGRGAGVGVAEAPAVSEAIAGRPSLSDEQRHLVKTVTLSGNVVDAVQGRAGSGKTMALDTVRHAYEASGFRPLGAALAARAAKELQAGSGIPSRTLAALRSAIETGRETLDGRTVVVVDEAAMVGTRQLAWLLETARRAGSKTIVVGDPAQLPEIEAGGLFSALARRLGGPTLLANRRQRDPEERAALVELRSGEVDRAVCRLERNGNVTLADNGDALRDRLVADWYEAAQADKDALMAALRREDIADLNARAHALLEQAGALGPRVVGVDDVWFNVGDQVMAHCNRYDLGLINGDVGTVLGASAGELRVRLRDGREVSVPVSELGATRLTHAYATTVHKAQGRTCERAFLLGDDSLFAEVGYTGLSRATERNQLYTVASSHDLASGPEDPLAHLRRALSVSKAKTAAIDVAAPGPPGPR